MAQVEQYRTIIEHSTGLYKEKGSKFISLAFPVDNQSQIRAILDTIKTEYYDARHRCYAWRLDFDGARTRANDDSEPSGTAGRPILGQILAAGLTNILIVVVRYFGGTKLGVSGLIQAYKEAAQDAILNATICQRDVRVVIRISFGYLGMNDVMRLVKEFEAEIESQQFDNSCSMELLVSASKETLFVERMSKVEALSLEHNGYK